MWILYIITILENRLTIHSHQFKSQESCKFAETQIQSKIGEFNTWTKVKTWCQKE